MENPGKDMLVENSMFSNQEMIDYLNEAAKWGKFLAIVGYCVLGLMILGGIFMMVGMSQLNNISGFGSSAILLGLVYLVIAVIYFFPVTYLYNFSVKILQGINSEDVYSVTTGIQNLKSMFKFMGIFTIVILSIYGLAFVIGIITMAFN